MLTHSLPSKRANQLLARIISLPAAISAALFSVFMLIDSPGISWGLPNIWHPDELVVQVSLALQGKYQFDTTNFDYPSLPKYVMYALGKLSYAIGFEKGGFVKAARLFSVVLGGGMVAVSFLIAQVVGASLPASILAGLLVLSNSEIAHNARFAHNDLYLGFFTVLSVLALLLYQRSGKRRWLYWSFLSVGLAASSKYNGISLLLAPALVLLLQNTSRFRLELPRRILSLILGLLLCTLGFALGTPKAITAPVFYFSSMIPALRHHSIYNRLPDSLIGFTGQWKVMVDAFGIPFFILALAAVAWFTRNSVAVLLHHKKVTPREAGIRILLLSLLAVDLPILVSYNYPTRFFVPLVPILAVISALFVEDCYQFLRQHSVQPVRIALTASILLLLGYSLLRVISVSLLFEHDSRVEATEYAKHLRLYTSIEYTLYPPNLPQKHFNSEHDYPIFFKKYADQPLPYSKYPLNTGEAGIEERRPDYLIVDSFTYDRFQNFYVCQANYEECQFFNRLLSGQTQYHRIASFDYQLPPYLPRLELTFVNPRIDIFERTP